MLNQAWNITLVKPEYDCLSRAILDSKHIRFVLDFYCPANAKSDSECDVFKLKFDHKTDAKRGLKRDAKNIIFRSEFSRPKRDAKDVKFGSKLDIFHRRILAKLEVTLDIPRNSKKFLSTTGFMLSASRYVRWWELVPISVFSVDLNDGTLFFPMFPISSAIKFYIEFSEN